MAELQFEGFSAERLTENLVAKADAENRNAGVRECFDLAHDVIERRRVAGAVRKKNPGGLVLQRVGGGRRRRQNLRGEPVLPQPPENVVFQPVIERDDGNVGGRHIVAAVLGVVITMGSLGGPPEQIGEKVAAALVGTFLGILLCYGVAGPLSSNMSKSADEHNEYLHVLRVLLLAFLKGSAPMIAIELGRRAIPAHVRPSFDEMEKNCKGQTAEAAAA